MKVYKVSGMIGKSRAYIKVKSYECTEKPKSYVSDENDIIYKSKLFKIDTIMYEDRCDFSSSFMYCLEDKKQLAINRIRNYLENKTLEKLQSLEQQFKNLKNIKIVELV